MKRLVLLALAVALTGAHAAQLGTVANPMVVITLDEATRQPFLPQMFDALFVVAAVVGGVLAVGLAMWLAAMVPMLLIGGLCMLFDKSSRRKVLAGLRVNLRDNAVGFKDHIDYLNTHPVVWWALGYVVGLPLLVYALRWLFPLGAA